MKILFVAMSESIHTARCINQVTDLGWDIRLFDSTDSGYVNADLRNAVVYHSVYGSQPTLDASVQRKGLWIPKGWGLAKRLLKRWQPDYHVRQLARLIQDFQPDIIHSLEFQHSGYLVLEARHWLHAHGTTHFPKWIVQNWGNDIYLFGRMPEHQDRIRKLLHTADYHQCECEREAQSAKELAMTAMQLPLTLVPGGLDIEQVSRLRRMEKPSERRIIAVRGYQTWSGRALFSLRGLELCADLLQGYKIVMYGAVPEDDMRIATTLFSQNTGIPVDIMPMGQPHDSILELFARSRIFVATSISDGVSYSMLEALSVGAFPIQSNTACADEWITDGETGLIVPPEDPQIIAEAIHRALTDDRLVDQAAERNAQVCAERLDGVKIRQQVIDIYQSIAQNRL